MPAAAYFPAKAVKLNGVDDEDVETAVSELFTRSKDRELPETIEAFRVSCIIGGNPSYVKLAEGKAFSVWDSTALLIAPAECAFVME